METHEYLHRVTELLSSDGYDVRSASVGGQSATVGYRSEFRWRWFATRLHVFVILREVAAANADLVSEFSGQAREHAKKNKPGLPRGLQTGAMAFPVVVTPVAEQGANEWARQRPKKHFALEENPVLVDVSAREASFYEGEIAWGMVYNRFRRLVITEYLVAPLESE